MRNPRQPRVVHLVPALFSLDGGGVVGGGERYAFELARFMAREVPTRLVTFAERGRRFRVGDLEVCALGNPWLVRGQKANPFAPGLVRELLRADVIHCHQQHVVASTFAALAGRLTGRRVFVTDLGGGAWDVSCYVPTDRWYHGHLHISEYSRKVYDHDDRPWARVILGGVDTDKFSPDPAAGRDGSVLYVGRLLPHKGVNDLVDAAPADLPVELIGRPYDPRFQEDLHRRAAGKRVTFRHDCDDVALVAAYRRALCLVLPSVYRTLYGQETLVPELLGQTLLEAMACGTPAICTNVASMPEVVVDGETGFIVPPNDPATLRQRLDWLRGHPDEVERMGRAARQRVLGKFTWPAVVRRCLAAYAAGRRCSERLAGTSPGEHHTSLAPQVLPT
jgi:glycosyltransferase involved in cell wall biosynthesis